MQVGDLVQRPWEHPGRIGLLIEQLPKSIPTGVTTGDFFVVQWTDERLLIDQEQVEV